jgi:signal peptide peptidase SppA
MRYERVTKFVEDHPWALVPSTLEAMLEVLALRTEGLMLSDEEIQARVGSREPPAARRTGVVAVLPLHGLIAHRMNLMTEVSGGMSTELVGKAITLAVNDPDASAIALDVDSPGGSVFGVPELADTIFQARGPKPIVAVANATAGSAAYWIASQADELIVTPSGQVGSIGVIGVHRDLSKQAAMLGVQHTFITAGKHKGDGNEFEPLDDDTRAHMQRRVDQYYDLFVQAVARGRGVSAKAVREGFGEGRIVSAGDALRGGMVDAVATLDQVVDLLGSGRKRVAPALAAGIPQLGMTAADEIADLRLRLAERGA